MADTLQLSDAELTALATGDSIVAITPRHAVDLNDELELVGANDASTPVFALVVAIQPAASLTEAAGDAVLLRVFAGPEPVLDDDAFAARRADVEAQWT